MNDSDMLQDNQGAYIALGVILIIIGFIISVSFVVVSIATTFLLGFMLLTAGVVLSIQSFFSGRWSTFFLHLFGGLLMIGAGAIIVANPSISLASFIILTALVMMATGAYRMIASIVVRSAGWGWEFGGGLLTLILGLWIWRLPPTTSLGVIGLLIGISIMVTGVSQIVSGMRGHNQPTVRSGYAM